MVCKHWKRVFIFFRTVSGKGVFPRIGEYNSGHVPASGPWPKTITNPLRKWSLNTACSEYPVTSLHLIEMPAWQFNDFFHCASPNHITFKNTTKPHGMVIMFYCTAGYINPLSVWKAFFKVQTLRGLNTLSDQKLTRAKKIQIFFSATNENYGIRNWNLANIKNYTVFYSKIEGKIVPELNCDESSKIQISQALEIVKFRTVILYLF